MRKTGGSVMLKSLWKVAGIAAALALATSFTTTPASAKLFEGCPSKPILGKFIEFGKSRKNAQGFRQVAQHAIGTKNRALETVQQCKLCRHLLGVCMVD